VTTVSYPEHTIIEILQSLEARGYTASFRIEDDTIPPGLYCGHCHRHVLPRRVTVDETWRFEGATDPGDEAILFAFSCPRCQTPATLLCAYGPGTGPAEGEVIAQLDGHRERSAGRTTASGENPA
jgi:hypothetical protein